jgi:gas vesicle structural protein
LKIESGLGRGLSIVDWREGKIMADFSLDETEHISLCEALDRILNKGAVVFGEVVISVANVDLIYLALQVVVGSVETARGLMPGNSHNTPPVRLGVRGVAGADVSVREK